MIRSLRPLRRVAAAAIGLGLTTAPALAAEHSVTMRDFAFEPAQLSVEAGDTVRFTNAGAAPHTATAASGGFDTGTVRPGASAEVTISGAGTLDYSCRFHPGMTGRIAAR